MRRWVPELARLDARFIYEPWKAPVAAQRKAGVRIVGAGAGLGGGDDEDKGLATYPKPMFDFGARRTFCLAAMKKAYAAGLRGDDKRLADKSGREQLYADRVDPEMEGGHADSSDDGADADEADHAGTGRDGHGRKAEAQRKTARPSQGAGSSHGQKRDQKKQGTLDRVVKRQKKG